mmetsp:Transcript_20417/g.63130  ORF Transcript_20417/g.63130 Transcript_20417/m.63130 type:complete len:361 (+) Transcript_20417:178-1260(+)
MGAATQYYLAKDHGIGAVVVDRCGLAAAASGRAGGFLAKDWNDGSPTEALTRASFDLHAQLGAEFPDVDYRRLTCRAVAVSHTHQKSDNTAVEWVDAAAVRGQRAMGDESTIAQVHPRKLVEALSRRATELASASVVKATAVGLAYDDERVTGLRVLRENEETVIEADAVVLAMGPWTHVAGLPQNEKQCGLNGWNQKLPSVVGTKYHSVLLRSPRTLNTAVFFQGLGDPEVYPRPDGEVYVTGFPERAAVVQDLPGETPVLADVCDRLRHTVQQLAPGLRGVPVHAQQACHLPSVPDGVPLVGEVPHEKPGAFVATGHGCWGILLAPATGKALAHRIATGAASPDIDLDPFSPRRFFAS